MRAGAELYFERWADPTFQQIGWNRTRGIVTCEPDWFLNTEAGLGGWPQKKQPVRWWQRADNSQTEVEIPNVKSITWDKSIDSDAATCTITLTNQWMNTNFAVSLANELGMPGYFTPEHGVSSEAEARWNHETNEWVGRLTGGALLRTYEGHGGFNTDGTSKTRAEMLADGDLWLTGVWQVDDVTIGARSKLIELKCRDMMALVIDQIIYVPFVPAGLYPLQYQRWVDTTEKINYTPKRPGPAVFNTGAPVPVRYSWSSTDAWYGFNFRLHGHRGTDSLDGSFDSYWLSVGNSGPDKPFATDYIEYSAGAAIVGGINVTCWRGGYQMFVSVMERGHWLGTSIIPYDHTPLIGNQPHVVDTGADIPYITQVGCPTDTGFTVKFPRPVRADKIRISFRHLVNSGIGPWLYRAGVREFTALSVVEETAASNRPFGWGTIESHPTGDGYWTMSYEGKIHAFGECVFHGDRYGKTSNTYVDMATTADGGGYLVLNHKGDVAAFGNATSLGSTPRSGTGGEAAVAIIYTHTFDGYWIVYRDGVVQNFGDATAVGNVSLDSTKDVITDVTGMTDDYGFWAFCNNGHVYEKGAAPDFGQPRDDPLFDLNHGRGLIASRTGAGFMAIGYAGWTSGFGDVDADAPYGTPGVGAASAGYRPSDGVYLEHVAVNAANTGYWALNTEGEVYARGDANRWGSPKQGVATIRRDGNYKDYADIVKDLLLWSGWFLYEDLPAGTAPSVFGNIETTGIYSPDPLPPDMFDKKHPIDPIKQLREIVGYLTWVDDDGAFRFESPNWWGAGNYYDDGTHTDFIPEIDERVQLTDYTARTTRTKDRSKIIITTDEPTANLDGTITTEYTPSNSLLRGQVIPTMIKVPTNVTKAEQEVMAELIALHLWFARRAGSITINPANPGLQINDQVRVFERVTAETYIHYIRGISSQHDLQTGVWTQTLTTNWLGTEHGDWAITAENIDTLIGEDDTAQPRQFRISDNLLAFIQEQTKKKTLGATYSILPTPDLDATYADEGAAAPVP